MDLQIDAQRYIDAVDHWIVDRPRTVIVVFLLVSGVFALGLGGSDTSSGTSQFTEDVPAQEALSDVNANFERVTFEPDTGTTQLIQSETNVLSKPSLLRMLRAQERLRSNPDMQVAATTSAARTVARTLDPSATTLDEQIDAVERATPSEIDAAVAAAAAASPGFAASLSTDFNARSASASATVGTVTHSLSAETGDGAGTSGSSPLTDIQQHAVFIVDSVGGDITVFGSGILSEEFAAVIGDSLALVVPAAVVLILFFLVFAYRDPIDLGLGIVSLAMAILWTFGFMGHAGIAFSQMLIAVPPLLLAVGIDFGIHAINRYREERAQGFGVRDSMRTATDQLLLAFVIVTGTTVIGFAANASSQLGPIRDFGLVAAVGIVFTFCIFGVFLPAAKVSADGLRERVGVPRFGSRPLGSEESLLGTLLPVGVRIARIAPRLFLAVLLVSTAWLGAYGSGVDSRFTQESFLPPEDNPDYLEYFPEALQPRDYTVTETTNFLEERFQTGEEDLTTVYVEGSLTNDGALESMWKAGDGPPDSFVVDGGHARETSIITVIRAYAERDDSFARLVARNDRNANGIPDDDLKTVYDALLDSPARERALDYITDDYTAARVEYAVEADASQAAVTDDTQAVADRFRFEATATGNVVVLKAVSDVIAQSAFISLVFALLGTAAFLVLIYGLLQGRPSLGIVNLVPIAVTVVGIAATMRSLDIPFNVLTGTILSIGIGLGIDYSAHLVHRFAEEYDESADVFDALTRTVRGTGGALTGSMLTTVTGIGVLAIAITPVLGQFGLLTGLSILYSYLASLIVLPPVIVVWARYVDRGDARITGGDASGDAPASG
ncbi:putative RND superfamily exporter protein [Halarchaeum solikamskense]|uniref:efflux RND transporter permease subunit n=1 Tax=Halarchaeum nitratireducens TaxID=489913 RepID=UPI001B3B0849|nr:MMPL family transporter [Halarchaeum solikamskense]MBP2249807.1 putative RND superfamily exporter protein [Halarchaeum solikamskense]